MLAFALFISAALAAPYGELRELAAAEQRLVPGDTAVLVGLAGELGCVAAHDPQDCEVMRIQPASEQPLVELVPVPAMVLPAVEDSPASLLLPRFPYGLGEPVTPMLGPSMVTNPKASWVRIPLPEGTQAVMGAGLAQILVAPGAPGPSVEPFVEPWGPPLVEPLSAGVAADAWPPQLMPYTRVQVLLPMQLLAVRVEGDDGVLVDLGWPTTAPAMGGQPLIEPAWISTATLGLAPATGLCMRAYYAGSLRRPSREPPVMPSQLQPPRLLVATDGLGQVIDAVPIDPPWDRAEPSACLRANARLLPAADVVSSIAVLGLSLPDAPDRPPAEPSPSSR